MGTILFTWELGAGLGHIMQFAPLANGLAARGHRVYCALRELRGAAGAFEAGVTLLAAPFRSGPPPARRTTRTFADVLRDTTFEDDGMLAGHVAAWRGIYSLVRPDLIVFDHSPTALLAARGMDVKRVVLGMGYIVPPGLDPFPPMSTSGGDDPAELRALEAPLLGRANRVLGSLGGGGRLEFLGQLYAQVDETFHLTFPELDPYATVRPADARVWGAVTAAGGGDAPRWPAGGGRKVYCYLRRFGGLAALLGSLRERGLPTVVYGDVDGPTRERFASGSLAFADRRLDPALVGAECDVQVMNSGHGSVASALLAGRPSLQLPLYQEQGFSARAVRRLGAGVDAPVDDGEAIVAALGRVLDGADEYARGARRFAARHGWFDARRQRERMLGETLALLE